MDFRNKILPLTLPGYHKTEITDDWEVGRREDGEKSGTVCLMRGREHIQRD